MSGRRELRRQKVGRFLAAGAALATAAGLAAGEIPDTVRLRALEELRMLDESGSRPARTARPTTSRPLAKPAASPSSMARGAKETNPPTSSPPKVSAEPSPATTSASPTTTATPAPLPPADTPSPAVVTPTTDRQKPAPATPPPVTRDLVDDPFHGLSEDDPFAEVGSTDEPFGEAETPDDPFADSRSTNVEEESPFEPFVEEITSPSQEAEEPSVSDDEPELSQGPMTPAEIKPEADAEPAITIIPRNYRDPLGVEQPVSVLDVLATEAIDTLATEIANDQPVIEPRSVAATPDPAADVIAEDDPFAEISKEALPTAELPSETFESPTAATPSLQPEVGVAPPANPAPEVTRTVEADSSHQKKSGWAPRRVTTPETAKSIPKAAEESTAVAQTTRSPEQQLLDARSDQDGMLGFCPVTLREKRSLTDGDSKFTSYYLGQTYTFASAEAKAAFDADPERYAPASDGCDVVLACGKLIVRGSLRHATYYQNRLYLFRSRQTYNLFVSHPERYVVTPASLEKR